MIEPEYEIFKNEEVLPNTSITGVKTRRRELWIVLILSMGIDWIASAIAFLLSPLFPIATIVVEEIIENIISNLISKYGLKQELSSWDNILGFLPIPGVTALTIRCVKELMKTYKKA